MVDNNETLLTAILSVSARYAFPADRLAEIVMWKGGEKQLRAFNMCDGTKAQVEIARQLNLDPGNFSRTVARWIDAGILFRLGEGREARLLHVYRLPADAGKNIGRDR